jgi:hypothetical protein
MRCVPKLLKIGLGDEGFFVWPREDDSKPDFVANRKRGIGE